MEVYSHHRYARSSAQKIRLVANLIRGNDASKALKILKFSKKKSANLIKKVLKSAIANAEHNEGMSIKNLKIKKIYVNVGPSMKRVMPRAKGRSDRILKRTSHITIALSEKKI